MAEVEKGAAARRHIIAVATRLFADAGYAGTPIEAILTAAGISRGALYHHFSSKEQVFEAVFDRLEAALAEAAMAASASVDGAERRLRDGCTLFLDHAQAAPFRQIGLIDAPAVLGWAKWRAIEARHGFGLLKLGLAAAAAERGGAIADVDTAAHLVMAGMIEAAMLVARGDAAAGTAAAVLNRVIDGILGCGSAAG